MGKLISIAFALMMAAWRVLSIGISGIDFCMLPAFDAVVLHFVSVIACAPVCERTV